jgi:hypothetical protein
MLTILAAYSAMTELVQSQIPGRSMQLVDLLQNLAGILVGSSLFAAWKWVRSAGSQTVDESDEVWQHPRRRSDPPLLYEGAGDNQT